MIRSILENDLYKFNMAAFVLRNCPGTPVKYKFFDRDPRYLFNTDKFVNGLRTFLQSMEYLRTTPEEISFLRERCPYLPPHFLDYMRNFKFDANQVEFCVSEDGVLDLTVEGPWESAIFWEVPLMAQISELYFQHCVDPIENAKRVYRVRTSQKISQLIGQPVADFGLRRRHSSLGHDIVVDLFAKRSPLFATFLGTSCVHLAHRHDLQPIGTQAHEIFMGYSALKGVRYANRYVLEDWLDTFKGNVSIALTDTFGTESFLRDFDGLLARSYSGVRHDSGCPLAWASRMSRHYRELGIDLSSKTFIFSDGLNPTQVGHISSFLKANEIDAQVAFGIGTNLTNNFGPTPLNIVIKMTHCDGIPVVKLSDEPGKITGDTDAIRVAQWIHHSKPLDS